MGDFKSLMKAIVPKSYRPVIRSMYFSLRSMLYSGNQVLCPCCGNRARKFLAAGNNNRPNVKCPRCNSLERHRLLWLYLQNRTCLFSDTLSVLHFAPELIFQKNLISKPNLDYVSADIASPDAMISMDITDIQCSDDSFDVILCSHVLEHVEDDQKALRELFRVLKPGGWAILQVPIDSDREVTFEDGSIVSPHERKRILGHHDHVRIYGRDYKNRLERAGFAVKVDDYIKNLGADEVRKYGLADEDIYLCTKSEIRGGFGIF